MSDIWDGLFDQTGLNTTPNSPPVVKPSTVEVAPSAKTEPAPSDSPKKRASRKKAALASTAPAAPDSVASDAFFLGGDKSDDVGTAGATATARDLFDETPENVDDLFDDDPVPEAEPAEEAQAEPKKKAGRPKGSKSKPVDAEEYAARMEAVDRGESIPDATFPVPVEPNVDRPTAPATGAFAQAFSTLVDEIVRRTIQEYTGLQTSPRRHAEVESADPITDEDIPI